jgi:hypothetical protein
MRMQFDQLMQVSAKIPAALRTSHNSWFFFAHQGAASWTKPASAETVAVA